MEWLKPGNKQITKVKYRIRVSEGLSNSLKCRLISFHVMNHSLNPNNGEINCQL